MIKDCMFYIHHLGLNTLSREKVNSAISVSYLSLTKKKLQWTFLHYFTFNILINFDQLYIITINIEKLSRNCTHTIQIGEVGRSDIEKGAYAYWYTINKSKCVSLSFVSECCK